MHLVLPCILCVVLGQQQHQRFSSAFHEGVHSVNVSLNHLVLVGKLEAAVCVVLCNNNSGEIIFLNNVLLMKALKPI